jgi:phosphodiesterase/alkaline phosphatase D-like protein
MSERISKRVMIGMMAMSVVLILMLNNIVLLPYLAFAQNNTNKLLTDGIASGDVTDNSAVIWSRVNSPALMHVQYDTNLSFSHAKSNTVMVDKLTDFAGHIKIDSLSPNTLYHYMVWFSPAYDNNVNTNSTLPTSDSVIGSFRTAPDHLW